MNAVARFSIVTLIAFGLSFTQGHCIHGQTGHSETHLSPRQNVLNARGAYQIDSIVAASFDDLVARISESDGEYFNLVSASALQPSPVGLPWVPLRAILVDRRVAKLYQLLSEMPRDRAAPLISSVFQEKLVEFKRDWEQVEQGNSIERRLGEPRRHGLAATLFLCQEFCEEQEFEQHLRSWNDWYQSNRHTSREFARRAGPDELMVINMYAIALAKRGVSLSDINLHVQTMCEETGLGLLPELQLHRFVRWDAPEANVANADFVLGEYPVFMNWGSARQLVSSDNDVYEIGRRSMTNARAWVRPPSLISQWSNWAWQRLVEWIAPWIR